ncbi:MAG: hypothetical protein MUF11_01225 [Beijerinckiaceae bacterium]|nr:hypothetical protein [Beijerinckiaceae bacterium]
MITRLMVALLALYIVSGGGKNWMNAAPGEQTAHAADSLPAQASLARQALEFCLSHRDICAEAAGSLVKATGSVPAVPPIPAIPTLPASQQAHAPGEAAPHLPVPPRRRNTATGA